MTTELILNSTYFQIFISLIIGALLGMERSFAGKTAGMRTYALVSMGSCLFVVISMSAIQLFKGYSIDPLHMAAGVVTGIGFLGAGAIIFKDAHLSGLTTAAGLWVACGLGLAVGYKLYLLAIFTAALTLVAFTLFWFIEKSVIESGHHGRQE